MLGVVSKKNKINLSDYQYKRDIENRLFLSELTLFDASILRELLFLPSKVEIEELLECAECTEPELQRTLVKFETIGLVARRGPTLHVDKELRKYFEFQISKFSDSFEPSFDYLQGLLTKVPINVLPNWYSISRTSDNIFTSIIEKYLLTPKIYETYLNELTFADPLITKLIRDVFNDPGLKVPADRLRNNYNLSKEKFQEHMLLLEFHFILVSSFDGEKEVITPFHEWAEYLKFTRAQKVRTLPANEVQVTKETKPVTSLKMQEDAMRTFRKILERWQDVWSPHVGSVERSVFEVEKALRSIPDNAWVLFEDFMKALIAPCCKQEPVTLQRNGRRWRYKLPNYNEQERAFIKAVIFELLQEVGITTIGTYQGLSCFMITPFGRVALGEQ